MPSPETTETQAEQTEEIVLDNRLALAGVHFMAEAQANPVDGMSTVQRMQQLALDSIGIEFPPKKKK